MGPLHGIKVIEFEAIGPGPFCGMMLADMGADVLLIDRPGSSDLGLNRERWYDTMMRGRRSVTLDMKSKGGAGAALELIGKADALIEGFRPGVMERLGVGPDVALAKTPRLVYGRMTGWGQDGPMAPRAGHDINYIALAGPLAAIGRAGDAPVPPLNLVGDFGGGSMFLITGILAALWERERSGRGQVIDAAIVDGVASLMTFFTGLVPGRFISLERDCNLLGGAAPFYRTYLCKDGREISVGPLEPQFFAQFLGKLGLSELESTQNDRTRWPELAGAFARVFASQDRDHWDALFAGTDACVAPVLTAEEAPLHPHNVARQTWVEHEGLVQAAPAPRFSRTPSTLRSAPDADAMLADWGVAVA